MLKSAQTEFIMEAHDGLSAKIVQEAGFKGIWASGLSISAAMALETIMKQAGLKFLKF